MKIVTTENGTRAWGEFSEKEPHTDEQTDALMKQLNQKAKALGIKTRYIVKDQD